VFTTGHIRRKTDSFNVLRILLRTFTTIYCHALQCLPSGLLFPNVRLRMSCLLVCLKTLHLTEIPQLPFRVYVPHISLIADAVTLITFSERRVSIQWPLGPAPVRRIAGSNPALGMDVCPWSFYVVLSCAGRDLRPGSPTVCRKN
jgi:hypothetical protein